MRSAEPIPDMREYVVLAAVSQEALEQRGADVEYRYCLTAKEAKQRARYVLTEAYRVASECSERLGYSQVLRDGECIADYFGKGSV